MEKEGSGEHTNYYKRYITKNGKKIGPYYYSSKKVDGKVITTYLGTQKPTHIKTSKSHFPIKNFKIMAIVLSIIIVALLIFLFTSFDTQPTGNPIKTPELGSLTGTVRGDVNDSNLTVIQSGQTIFQTPQVQTSQSQARINKPVTFTASITLSSPGPAKIQIPSKAENIVIYKVDQDEGKEKVSENRFSITARASSEIILDKSEKPSFLRDLFKKIKSLFTGKVVDVSETQNLKEITINENSQKYEVEYQTPAPYTEEISTTKGKTVKVIGQENIPYENVLVFTNIENLNIDSPSKVKIYWIEQETYLDYDNLEDTDSNGIYDNLEWTVPSLSNQTFEIIVITKAQHLDENREVISDIYDEVKELDDVFSEAIPDQHYVRVTFEQNLTSEKDITIFPLTAEGSPRIEIYEKDQNNLVAEFTSLTDNEYNQVLLTNLQGSQDTFDLKIIGGSIFIDHIIDPVASPGGATDLRAQTCAIQSQELNQNTFGSACAGTYPNICGSSGDRLSCEDSVTETALSNKQVGTSYWAGVRIESYNTAIDNCASIDQVSLCYTIAGSPRQHSCYLGVDSNGGVSWSDVSISCSTPAPIGGGSAIVCQDVTALESWTCSNFFGSTGTRALGKIQAIKTGASGTTTWNFDVLYFDVTYTESASNQPPIIDSIEAIPAQDPTESSTTFVVFTVDASDPNGQGDITNVRASFTKGTTTREDTDCTYLSGTTYACTVDMQYYDEPGTWNVGVTVEDSLLETDTDLTNTFTYNLLNAFTINSPLGGLTWQSPLNPGDTNQFSNNDPAVIENTGNFNGEISITAYDLVGQTTPSETIPASNFRVGPISGSECSATQLQDSNPVTVTDSTLPRGPSSTEEIYYCLTSVPLISSQTYSTAGASWWIVEVV